MKPNPNVLLTPRQVALAIGVSEASLKRWCDRGVLASIRTAGGHRRLTVPTVIEFLRSTGRPIVRPELLALPSTPGTGMGGLERAADTLLAALLAADEQRTERTLLDLFLGRRTVAEICDQTIAPAMRRIGELWEAGEIDIYEERRASEICNRALLRLRCVLPPVPENARRAVGCAWEGDGHSLPSLMAEVTLRECGWNALSYGPNLPLRSILRLLRETRPKLLWLSVCWLAEPEALVDRLEELRRAAREVGAQLAIGGRSLDGDRRAGLIASEYCASLAELVALAAESALSTQSSGADAPRTGSSRAAAID